MRAIEEFNYKGTYETGEPFSGMVTAGYTNNIKNAKSKGLKKASIRSFELKKKIVEMIAKFVEKLTFYFRHNPELARSVLAGSLAVMMMGTFTGCKIHPKASEKDPIAMEDTLEEDINEPRASIEYIVKPGDNLTKIVKLYTDKNIQKELDDISFKNNIDDPNFIFEGQKLKLEIPESKLAQFGCVGVPVEEKEWDKMIHYIDYVFDSIKPSDQNEVYSRNIRWVYGPGNPGDEAIMPQVMDAIDGYYEMTGNLNGFFSPEKIKEQESKIFSILRNGVEIADSMTYMFGKPDIDYKYYIENIYQPPLIAVPIDQVKNLDETSNLSR
jgi:hypothetical protein